MRQGHWAVRILQKIAVRAVQNTGRTTGEARGMRTKFRAAPARLYSNQSHAGIAKKSVEDSDAVAAATDAGEYRIRQPLFAFENLAARLFSGHAVKIAHHHRIGM